ncbi:MAG: lipase maturation factor family protein [Acidimicrobiia bacterium]
MDRLADLMASSDYHVAREVLARGLALVYLVAFLNVRNQFRALLGEKGLLPVPAFLAQTNWRAAPTLFHWRYSDRLVAAVAWAGMALTAAVVVGVVHAVPLWIGVAMWLVIWFLYLSVVNVGQTFYGFGWESLLLEAGFYAAFLGNAATAPPVVILFAFRWLLFLVVFGSGLI